MDFWTQDVNGEKRPEVPLFLITSDKTFSGAEEFSYNMQTQKRATLVGQITRGGANPGRLIQLDDKLETFIPVGMAINPITKSNWEGKGVVPEVITLAENAFTKTYELAKIAAKEFNDGNKEIDQKMVAKLIEALESFEEESDEEKVFNILKVCNESDILEEAMINGIGYDYLMNYKKPLTAKSIFKANTILFPESANVHDSYGETLASLGKLQEAAKSYQKAIDIAKQTNSRDLEYYQENLKKVKDRM